MDLANRNELFVRGVLSVIYEIFSHRHEHGTVVCSTQLGDTVQENSGHLLVLVLYKAEYFKGKPAHLALPILEDGGLGVFFTAGGTD